MARKKRTTINEADIKPVDISPEATESMEEVQEESQNEEIIETPAGDACEDTDISPGTNESLKDKEPSEDPVDEHLVVYKTYQLIDQFKLSFNINVNGRTTRINFDGGVKLQNYQTNGKYSTSNRDVQAALENDPYFNKKYILKREQKYEKQPEVTVEEQRLPDKTVVEGITTTQQAKEWMLSKFQSLAPENLKNRKTILATADKLNVSFPKLK